VNRVRATLLVILLVAAPLAAQLKPGVIADANTVWVHATVTDASGRLVTGLGRDEFEVLDNGVRQEVRVFSNQIMPFSAALMLDNSGSMRPNSDLVRRAGEEFVGQFVRGDRAVIGSFGAGVAIGERFFANRNQLLDAIPRALMAGGNLPCLTPTMMEKGPRFAGPSPVWDAIECGIMTLLTDGEAIRRVVLVITDGRDHSSATNEDRLVRLAGNEGVMVYAVGLVGEEGVAKGSLRDVALKTGGGFVILKEKDDFGGIFRRLAEELHRQYILGFTPQGAGAGKHTLTVNVARPGLTVRARQTYDIQPVK
jgi:Ca-activated chloride channel family protein